MNDLPSCVSNTESLLFVDDTKCFCNVSQPSDITMLQNDLNSVVSWSKAWGLNFNPSKSIHKLTTPRNLNNNLPAEEWSGAMLKWLPIIPMSLIHNDVKK